jgi:hypothetical protein
MKEKLADLAQKIAQAAHLGGVARSEQLASDAPSAGGSGSPVPASKFHWSPSFLGTERATQPPDTSTWERAKQACLNANNGVQMALPLSIQIFATIGREIWAARQIAPGKAMQIVSGSKLVAVLSTATALVSVRTDIEREDLAYMTALVRPDSASGTPVGFKKHDLWDLLWQYGAHDATALLELPGEVAWRPLQLRRLPQVSPYLLQPRHASLLRHLLDADKTFDELVQLTHETPEVMCQDVASMMLTRSMRTA